MPDMDGLELTRQFLALQGTMLSPVLIVSAYGSIGERLAGFEAGAVDFIAKPFSSEELHARIRSQLAVRTLALRLHETENLASMGLLSSGLAHELRTPVNAIVSSLEPLWSLLPASERVPDSAGHTLHDVLSTAAHRMRELCNNIVNFSRQGPLVTRAEDIRVLIQRACSVLESELAPVRLIEEVALDRPIVCAGPMIEQVLVNLIDNGAYAAGPGGEVRVAAWANQGQAMIEISDSGPGVPRHLQRRVFEPFFTTKPQGTGLGLAVSRRIALDHGGDLRVVRRGDGTAFRLALPAPP
jgi:signal transduction histidine kinase